MKSCLKSVGFSRLPICHRLQPVVKWQDNLMSRLQPACGWSLDSQTFSTLAEAETASRLKPAQKICGARLPPAKAGGKRGVG